MTLGPGDVHLWRADLPLAPGQLEELSASLSPEERARIETLAVEGDRHRAAASRGVLRSLLSRYLEREPSAFQFAIGGHGKPYLPGEALRFNVSHSGERLLIALALDREVGVDVERIRPEVSHLRLARRYFAPEEYERLAGVPQEVLAEEFTRTWVLKEAYVKARGTGIANSLGGFSVVPGEPASLTCSEADRWSLRLLECGDGYAAAVCAEQPFEALCCFRWG